MAKILFRKIFQDGLRSDANVRRAVVKNVTFCHFCPHKESSRVTLSLIFVQVLFTSFLEALLAKNVCDEIVQDGLANDANSMELIPQ